MDATPYHSSRLRMPGFGLPVDTLFTQKNRYTGRNHLPHAITDYVSSNGITLRERRMLEFIGQITDKPNWTSKVFDKEIIAKWKGEGVRWDASLPEAGDWWLSETMFEVCIQELQEKAKVYEKTGVVAVLDVEATIVKSDCAVSVQLQGLLREAVRQLEDVPEKLQDWHPGSDRKVLDLLHPSLFPLVYGVSRVLPTGTVPLRECPRYTGMGEQTQDISSIHPTQHVENGWSVFQWLPSQIQFADDGLAKITSYVNNLHPHHHAKLYPVLGGLVDAAIPLWNECISWYHSRMRIVIRSTDDEDYTFPDGVEFPREVYRKRVLDNPDNYNVLEIDPEEEAEWDDQEWSENWDCDDEYQDWKMKNRVLVQREPSYTPQAAMRDRTGAQPIDLKKDFREQGLQVIFKLANIHLTPEQSRYEGGSWHVEGSLNEHICATALFYIDCENVTESRLAFRQSMHTDDVGGKPAQVSGLSVILLLDHCKQHLRVCNGRMERLFFEHILNFLPGRIRQRLRILWYRAIRFRDHGNRFRCHTPGPPPRLPKHPSASGAAI
jgi:hypothetical protein